jgi:6-pyruvoyltetrahydropterin/6-carboxytetrahydropterin synthase
VSESMQVTHTISRRIEIDAAHRVPGHTGKCRHLHGHRYVVEAVCAGKLASGGHGSGMVMDFAFLKEEMVAVIDAECDHAAILWSEDPLLATLAGGGLTEDAGARNEGRRISSSFGPILVLPFTPTAENLAHYWFDRLKARISSRSEDRARLIELRVFETPNSCATYSA